MPQRPDRGAPGAWLGAADFRPGFRFAREIEDALTGQVLRAEGTVCFTPDAAGLIYAESGRLHLPGRAPMQAERRYLWRFEASGVAVFFEDGRPFHHFVPAGQGAGSDHPCGSDHYRVAYDFTRWPCWTATWRVTGPRKAYVSRTLHEPLA
ncbi:MAG: DUF6314 family protein [Salibaculum sp.]|jgi:hypothetical protein|uniref:DUF6314 family protein n=1 Tax=Roseovarius halophilus (ex Wu et al. 2025) TaxID=3376060 RepID=UPI00287053F1|nr:DUF6314 family protein [Salibaculum sp.]MDR9428009.1 DUF6314 family protein [Salibaculum sp.]MDR9482911.1 DUF6314 family protein [Salibaculum sp.]